MSWLDKIGGGLGAGSNMFDSFLHPEKGYEAGQDELNKYFGQGQGYLQPYNQFGLNAYGDYSGAMKRLLDPAALEGEWIKGYSESPAAKNAEAMAEGNGLNAASSLGLMGSNTALNAIQSGTSRIGMEDRQNYLNDLMQKYLAGTGIAGNIFNTGAGAANNMANNAMNMGNNSAQMAFGRQNAPGSLFGNLLGAGIGYMTGGPMGAAAGAGAGGSGGRGWSFGGG